VFASTKDCISANPPIPIDPGMYIYGGINPSRLKDLYCFDIKHLSWVLVEGKGQGQGQSSKNIFTTVHVTSNFVFPPAIYGHTSVYSPVSKSILVFGGRTDTGIITSLWKFALDEGVWEEIGLKLINVILFYFYL
jgi:ABC-type enterochelin transport system permease subunit